MAMSPTEYQEFVTFIGRRFDTIADRVDRVDRRFDALHAHIDARFREVSGHFDEIYRRDALDRDLTELRRSVGDLESRVDQIQRRLPS